MPDTTNRHERDAWRAGAEAEAAARLDGLDDKTVAVLNTLESMARCRHRPIDEDLAVLCWIFWSGPLHRRLRLAWKALFG